MTSQSVERKSNVSEMLLLPCIKLKQDLMRQFSEFGFVNSYLYCERYWHDFNTIYLVFKPTEFSLGFFTFCREMEKNINFVEIVDEPSTVILVYKIPAKFGTDYLLFLNGAYSKTSPDFKACFQMKIYKQGPKGELLKTEAGSYQTEHTMYYHIFNKTEHLRNQWISALGDDIRLPKDMELYDKCDISKETLVI